MNHMTRNVSSAIVQCRRFTQCLTFSSRAKGSTQQILNSGVNHNNNMSDLVYIDMVYPLDSAGTLQARALKGSERAASRIARSVAAVIGISLFIPMSNASSGSIDAIQPKDYVRLVLPKKEAICLSRLIGKESAWNHKAIGNLDSPSKNYVYGLLQIKNPIAKYKTPIEQIDLGIKYINHRYQGDTCKAWQHWKDRGWH
jgi:hypothetical protein